MQVWSNEQNVKLWSKSGSQPASSNSKFVCIAHA
jgi:hypothetical protein